MRLFASALAVAFLLMKDNYTIKDWMPGESRHLTGGVHGGVRATEMHVSLIVAAA